MNEKLQKLMLVYGITFDTLSRELNLGKKTLTRKFNGETDWTFQEMMIIGELFDIDDIESFFFG